MITKEDVEACIARSDNKLLPPSGTVRCTAYLGKKPQNPEFHYRCTRPQDHGGIHMCVGWLTGKVLDFEGNPESLL